MFEELKQKLREYHPFNPQEEKDKERILLFLEEPDIFERTNETAHMTASAWVVDPERTKVLMVYHRIYDSWSWLGGHADGDTDLLRVAMKEVREESGLKNVRPVSEDIFSLEILGVSGHEKKGQYVSSHIHLNLTYLLEASPEEPLKLNEAETAGVRWFTPEEALRASSEPWFVERVYKKLIGKVEEMS